MPKPALGGLLPYFGAKRMQAPAIVAALGEHQAYYEPFFGSGAVLFAKPAARQEVVCDLHGGVTNLARVVQDDTQASALFDRVLRTQFNQSLYDHACYRTGQFGRRNFDERPDLDAAYYYLVTAWMGRNGLAGTTRETRSGFCKRFTSNGGDPAARFRAVADSIPDWWLRLRNVTVIHGDGVEVLGRVEDKAGTAVYLDPPYFEEGGRYRHGFAPGDHDRLAAAASRFTRTRVVVSYYRDDRLDGLYPPAAGWVHRDAKTKKQMTNRAKDAPEVLLVKNGVSDG